MSDVLKKPVHVAVLKPTYMQQLAKEGKMPNTAFSLPTPNPQQLPGPEQAKVKLGFQAPNLVKRVQAKTKLRMVHDNVPPIPADKQPPCDTCKTAACCRAFVVNITELEYESGIYGDAAVKLTPEISKQLRGLPSLLTAPRSMTGNTYYLEGKMGEPCPFLTKDNKCGIYDIRPVTCRVYTCADDDRITEDMRSGADPITEATLIEKQLKGDE